MKGRFPSSVSGSSLHGCDPSEEQMIQDQRMARKVITMANINPLILSMSSDDLAPTVRRAIEIERELKKGITKPFTEVIRADVNDNQAMGQKPVTFIRQVLTVCSYPLLLGDPSLPTDVKQRANAILDDCGGRSTGAYTYSDGIDLIRTHIAEYLEARDGVPAFAENISLSSGGIEALRSILNILNSPNNGTKIGVLVPIPRDPVYTDTLNEFGIKQIDYYLNEENGWSVDRNELQTAVENANLFCVPKALLVINPGNPTGSLLTPKNIEEIIKFAMEKKLVLLADEAYQFNAYGQEFYSFKEIMMKMEPPYNRLELVSIMSGSTGTLGESGLRAGCCELVNIQKDVIDVYRKSICVKMCPSVIGQIAFDCMVCPPKSGEPSYQCFVQESNDIIASLHEKACILTSSLNSIDGIQCQNFTAATFVFAKIHLPEKAKQKAKKLGLQPDMFYAKELLEATGICSLPGCLYGQKYGTYHIRLTILPKKEKILKLVERIRKFHASFMEEYNDKI